jgi:hypothetical protein
MKPWRRDVRDKVNQFVENESGGKFVTSEYISNFKRLQNLAMWSGSGI